MTEAKKILRWLRVAAALQMTIVFLVEVIFTGRILALADSLRDSLYMSGVAAEEVNKVDRAFSSITNDLYGFF